ncbi:Uncharacterised protein g10814 [Pycnogonum litorale]
MVSKTFVILLIATICLTMIEANRAKRETDSYYECRIQSRQSCDIKSNQKNTKVQDNCYRCLFSQCKKEIDGLND